MRHILLRSALACCFLVLARVRYGALPQAVKSEASEYSPLLERARALALGKAHSAGCATAHTEGWLSRSRARTRNRGGALFFFNSRPRSTPESNRVQAAKHGALSLRLWPAASPPSPVRAGKLEAIRRRARTSANRFPVLSREPFLESKTRDPEVRAQER